MGKVIISDSDYPCGFNVSRDVQAVVQVGFIDLKMANVTSSIPEIDGLGDERYNGIDDPRSIGARPSDVFEEMQANKATVSYKAPESSSIEE